MRKINKHTLVVLLLIFIVSCKQTNSGIPDLTQKQLDSLLNVTVSQKKQIDSLTFANMKLELDKINDKFDKATSSPVNTKDEAIQAFREHIGVYYPNCIYKDFKAIRKPNSSFDIIFKHKRKDGYDTRYYYCTYNVNLNTNKVIHVSGTLEGMCNF